MEDEKSGAGESGRSFSLDSDGFACTRVFDEPEVWRVELLMGQTFLPSVNVFVVRDGTDTLLVDTGTPDELNDTRLMRALVRLGVDPARTTLFCTHGHIDHAGQARELALAGIRACASAGSVHDMERFSAPEYSDYMIDRMVAEGVTRPEAAELAGEIWSHNVSLAAQGMPCEPVEPGDRVRCGSLEFEVVATSGHTPGHAMLWLPEKRLAFTGDAVLFACSACICFWGGAADSIGDQMATLRRMADMGIDHAFLGHGLQEGDLGERCLANLAHHERRSARALAAVGERPGSTGFELVSTLGWHVNFERWEDLPALTRWFLVSESIAHLDHLVAIGQVRREADAAGVSRYRLV